VTTLGGELTRAIVVAAEAQTRWETAHQQLEPVRRRRAEIAAGLEVLISEPAAGPEQEEEARRLAAELAALDATAVQLPGDPVADARTAGLRREIASTGLRGVPVASVDELIALLQLSRRRSWWAGTLALLAAAGAAGAAWLLSSGAGVAAFLGMVAAALALAGLLGFNVDADGRPVVPAVRAMWLWLKVSAATAIMSAPLACARRCRRKGR